MLYDRKITNIEKDYEQRVNPELVTGLLREAVPVIDDMKFRFLEVGVGYCKSLLPLNHKSSNQHGTHQALLLGMGGDYTGGLALAAIIQNETGLGIHEITPDKGMSLWLIKSEMEYLKPSTDDVVIEATIPTSMHDVLIKRYHNCQTILLDVEVSFSNLRNENIAIGKFRYFCNKA